MKKQLLTRIITGLIAGSIALCATAEVYTWKDATGKTVYSDQPPPGVKATPMRVKASSAPAPAKKAGDKQTASEPAKEAAKGKDAAEAYNARIKTENCKNARTNLQKMQAGLRIATPDGKGGKNFPTEKDRADMTRQAQKDVDTWCK